MDSKLNAANHFKPKESDQSTSSITCTPPVLLACTLLYSVGKQSLGAEERIFAHRHEDIESRMYLCRSRCPLVAQSGCDY
jgi:hypothetical protein